MEDNNVRVKKGKEPFEIEVKIAPDYLSAFVTVYLQDPLAVVKISDIENALAKKNVSFGIDKGAIKTICDNPAAAKDVVVAKGIPTIDGVDGKIEYKFDTETKSKPKINEDGSVDFKNSNFLLSAKRGQILAVKIPPTAGKTGTLVTGKQMKAKQGKIVNFKMGKNVFLSENSNMLISALDGNIEFVNGTVSVIHVLDVNGDVGLGTGNIDFSGRVNISGNVMTGFSVKATEDVVIGGLVEGAIIETDGNLTINGGIQGNEQAVIKVGGDLTVKFISSAAIHCSGNIESGAITHSDIMCDNVVRVSGKRGIIVGGNVYSTRNIIARQIGSEMGVKTSAGVGITKEMLKEYQSMQDEMQEVKLALGKIEQVLALIKKQAQASGGDIDPQVLEKTLSSQTSYKEQLLELDKSIRAYGVLLEELKKSSIKVGDVFPGVRLKLGNSFYSVKDRLLQTEFVKVNAGISLIPWEETI